MKEKTLGEIRVITEFNPEANKLVDQIKQKSAELINLVDSINLMQTSNPGIPEPAINFEIRRLKDLAMNSYEEAAMWAVKAATA